MAGLPTPIAPAQPTPAQHAEGYQFRRTQDIVSAQAYGAAVLFEAGVGGNVQTPPGEPPFDGKYYVVKNGQWVALPIQGDAPSDGQCYGRMNGQWVDLVLDMGTY